MQHRHHNRVGQLQYQYCVQHHVQYEVDEDLRRPYASLEQAISIRPQLQLPIVLVQFNKDFYNGDSFLPNVPRIVPIIPKGDMSFDYRSHSLFRVQLPLSVLVCNNTQNTVFNTT